MILFVILSLNPNGILPNRIERIEVIDSIPYSVYDTVYYEVEVEIPVEVFVDVIVEVPTQQLIDTMSILKVFYDKNEINETLTLPNGIGTLVMKEVISENKVQNRSFTDINVKKQKVLDTIMVSEVPKSIWYFGVDTNYDTRNFISNLGIGLMYKTKTEKIYKIGVGVNNTIITNNIGFLNPYVGGSIYWKIKTNNN